MAIKKSQLYSSIWQACDELRGGMDASEYKDYVLVLLFVRYVSDKYSGKKNELVIVPEGGSFADLVKLKGKPNIGEGIDKVLSVLAEENDLKDVINSVSFNDDEKLGKGKEMVDRLSNLVAIFENSELDFSKNKAEGDDLLGDAYEYLMKHFAVESGKSKGQFYTPAEVSRIIAKVIGAKDAKGKTHTVYDPTCGSGSLLLKVAAETPRGIAIFGQEKENATATLAILNMWLHGEPTAEIKKGQSTLSNPLFIDQHGVLKTFDYVVANPPFSYKAWRNGFNPEEDPHGRFEGFGIPPKKNGDFAFLLHIIKSLKSSGKGAVILPHGVLFRGNTEADIRKALIQRGYIKGVIGLPANLFYGTGIPACIIVIDKENSAKRTGIFMIDASKGFIKDGNKNRLREQDIRKAVDVWNDHLEITKYSRFVPNDEIKKNEYNLNIPRYIDTQEVEDIQDIEGHLKGGIPNVDIDALEDYWQVCPSLKKALFKSSRSGYCALAITPDEVRKTILSHSEFVSFRGKIVERFASWRKDTALKLAGIDTKDHPKAIIQKISDDVLKVFQDAYLLDKYDIYQCLMSYWEDVMQDDAHIITADGWQAGNEVLRQFKETKKKDGSSTKKEIAGLYGLEGRLIPVALLINAYFAEEQEKLDELNVKLGQTEALMDELKEEYNVEDGLLSEVIENDRIRKGDVDKRIKEIKGDADYADELKVLKQYADLFDKEAEIKKQIKESEADLEKKVIARYPELPLKEVKSLVVESKWMDELQARIIGEVDRLSQRLAWMVKELAERYSEPLPKIADKVNELTKKVERHLKKMGFKLR
jgi:type I restriction enzyme M protein